MQPRSNGEGVEVKAAKHPVRSYRDLIAWQRAHALALLVYRHTREFPAEERFGLTAQLRRSAVSIGSNVAEGYGRSGRTDYVRFLKVARGSVYELDSQWLLARDLGFPDAQRYDETKAVVDECERVLAGLIRSLERDPRRSTSS